MTTTRIIKAMWLATALGAAFATACGGGEKQAAPAAAPPPPEKMIAEPLATSTPTAAPSAEPAVPPAPKGTFHVVQRSASSGKVDKVGARDGLFKPDGVKDLVLEVEYEGAATALLLVTTDAQGTPNGEFTADTFVGAQTLPPEVGANLNQGQHTAGIGVYEGDKLLNGKDGALGLAEGRHKLTLYVSSKDAPKAGSFKVLALTPEKQLVTSGVATLDTTKK